MTLEVAMVITQQFFINVFIVVAGFAPVMLLWNYFKKLSR